MEASPAHPWGGIFFTFSLVLTVISKSFLPLLISFIIFFPASGAFVSLSQATLMDSAPERHAQNMARWTFAGSLGNVFGPILLGLFVYFGLGWRGAYPLVAAVSALCLLPRFASSRPTINPSPTCQVSKVFSTDFVLPSPRSNAATRTRGVGCFCLKRLILCSMFSLDSLRSTL
ncbi:MAG: MFS transporter [Anaerolineales bacterium]|nr:MFS transporter [Anaerolineales bacterium]